MTRAQIAALRTAGDPTGRYGAKWQLVRNLYDLRLDFRSLDDLRAWLDAHGRSAAD